MQPTRTISINLNLSGRVIVAAACLLAALVLALTNINAQGSSEPGANNPEAQGADSQGGPWVAAQGSGPRHVYVTITGHVGDEVLTACAAGYHTASIWELLDISNLVYDYDHPAAKTRADSGFGPPSNWNGWVRTGYDSSDSAVTGTGNCHNWTSGSPTDNGVMVRLTHTWATPTEFPGWDATSIPCSQTTTVWCVRN